MPSFYLQFRQLALVGDEEKKEILIFKPTIRLIIFKPTSMSDIGILFFPFSYISGTYFFYSGNRFLVVIMNRKNYELFLVSCSFNNTSGLYKIVVWNHLNIQTPETISFV